MAMSNPLGDGTAPGTGRAQILVELERCLAEWHRALTQGVRPDQSNLVLLRGATSRIQPQLIEAGFGGIAVHLGELMRRFDVAGSGDARESLQALSELSEHARHSLTHEEETLFARLVSASGGWTQRSSSPVGATHYVATPRPAQSPQLDGVSAGPQKKQQDAPHLLAPSLLRLRAFGARKDQASSDPSSQAASDSSRSAPNVRDLLRGIRRSRSGRLGKQDREQSELRHRWQNMRQGWRIVVTAVVLVLGLGGIATPIVYLMRRANEPDRIRDAPPAVSAPSGKASPSSSELPRTRLLDEDETFSAVLAQVHGRGKESSELRALVDEQAALAARTLTQQKCDESPAACAERARIRQFMVGQKTVQRITPRRAAGSANRNRPSWLAGLKLPELPIEDDPRVQRSLEYYTERPVGRELFQAMLFRCGAYRELIESTLVRNGLPIDLLAVVFAESGCEPESVSPIGAAGLWQLMPETARAYGLWVKKGVVDERRSAPKSTEAAVRFLHDLRDKMAVYHPQGVWDLVLGAYNLGPFAMAARVERAGGDVGFWDLLDAAQLPDETVQYTSTIQAIVLILNNLQRFNFAGVQLRAPQLTSDLEVPPGTRLSLIARAASTSVDRIRLMNLDVSGDRTPDIPDFAVQVPKEVVWQARDTLKGLMASGDESDLCVVSGFDWGSKHFTKEMEDACKRKLRARTPDPKGPPASTPPEPTAPQK